jgi:hypothetical protein
MAVQQIHLVTGKVLSIQGNNLVVRKPQPDEARLLKYANGAALVLLG